MTIIGASQGAEEPSPDVPPSDEPDPDPVEEPELPPAATVDPGPPAGKGRRWRSRSDEGEAEVPEAEPLRHVRVLPADEGRADADPWEQGFDAPEAPEAPEVGEPEEQTEDGLLVEGRSRRRFRRR
jgi:hypothetical protein